MAKAEPESIVRKIYFYRVYNKDDAGVQSPVNIPTLLQQISALRYDNGQAYLGIAQGVELCAWAAPGGPGRLILGTTRSKGLSEVEEAGQRSPLPLTRTQKLLECTHALFFSDGILGAEFNFNGPRVLKLPVYLTAKCPTLPELFIDPITERNVAKQLADLQTMTMLRMRVHRDYIDLLRQAEGTLADALNALNELSDAPVVEIVLKQEARVRKSLGEKAWGLLRAVVGAPLVREVADTLEVKGRDRRIGKTRTFDFLRDNFASAARVTLQGDRSRAVDSNDMFEVIDAAYNE